MKFESPQASENSPEQPVAFREKVHMPHIEPLQEILAKNFEGEEINLKAVEDILYAVLEENLNNASVYESEKHEAAFPWTVIDTADVAKKLYHQICGKIPELSLSASTKDTPSSPTKKEFLFTSFNPIQSTGGGNILTFFEEITHEIIKKLPNALADIKEGKEPEHVEIYNLGSPTNDFGKISPEFLQKISGGRSFKGFGALYAEFVRSRIKEASKNTHLYFHGISMGGSLAAESASELIGSGLVTQVTEHGTSSDKPYLQVRIDTPPGPSDMPSWQKNWQVPLGFGMETALMFATDKYMRQVIGGDKKFISEVTPYLISRGLVPDMSTEQVELKKCAITEVVNDLRKGVSLPPDVKVTEVMGMYDLLMYSPGFNKKVHKQKEKASGSLGEKFVSGDPKNPNRRKVGIRMTHAIPNFRDNELKRWKVAIDALQKIKK